MFGVTARRILHGVHNRVFTLATYKRLTAVLTRLLVDTQRKHGFRDYFFYLFSSPPQPNLYNLELKTLPGHIILHAIHSFVYAEQHLLSFDGTTVTGSGLFIDCVRFATMAGFSPSFSLVLLFVDILRDKC